MRQNWRELTFEEEFVSLKGSNMMLTPVQQKAADDLFAGLEVCSVVVLRAETGLGKTSVLRWIHAKLGGAYVVARQFMRFLQKRSPAAVEETFMNSLERALDGKDLVMVDDWDVVTAGVRSFNNLSRVLASAEARGKKLVFAGSGREPEPIRERACTWELEEFEAEDFQFICRHYLGEAVNRLDFAEIHRFAPMLNGYQLKNACLWLGFRMGDPSTKAFIEYLRERNAPSVIFADDADTLLEEAGAHFE